MLRQERTEANRARRRQPGDPEALVSWKTRCCGRCAEVKENGYHRIPIKEVDKESF